MNCFLVPGHSGPHQFTSERIPWIKQRNKEKEMAEKKDSIQLALENVADAAKLLAIHGAEGYSLDSSALDVVFLRSLRRLSKALQESGNLDRYDPHSDITYSLTDGVE
jgi:hypothetical protein